jgi:tetratricopeptide (TPR) repeat protein
LALVAAMVWHERIGRKLGGPFETFLAKPHSPALQRRCWTMIAIIVGGSLLALLARQGDWPWLTLSIGIGAAIAYWGFKVCPVENSKRALAAVVVGGFAMSLAANFFVGVVSGQTSVAATTGEWANINTKLSELISGQKQIQTEQAKQGQEQQRQGEVQQEQGQLQNRMLDNSERLLAIEAIKANPNLSDEEKYQQILALTGPSQMASPHQEPPLKLSPSNTAFLERMAKNASLIDQVRTANALGKLDEAARLREQYIRETTQAGQQPDYEAFVAFGDTEWLADRYNEAGEWYEMALAIRDNDWDVVNKAGISFLRVRAGKDFTSAMASAERWLRRGISLLEVAGTDHLDYAAANNNLAQLLVATNRLGEAEPLMRRALAIAEASLGQDHPTVAVALNNLAELLARTHRVNDAEPLIRRALAIDEASFGENHPNVAGDLNNLAVLLKETNRMGEAEPLMRRALAIEEASFGKDHPNVAGNLYNLASLLMATKRLDEAEPLMRRALAIDEKTFGKDHPNVARDVNDLAQLLKATKRLSEAEPLMRRALAIDEASFGNDHPKVARDLNNLALLLRDTKRLDEAEPLMKRAVEIKLKTTAAQKRHTPNLRPMLDIYQAMLVATGKSEQEAREAIAALCKQHGVTIDR